MESTPRYEILNTIATGDFATVFRARDRELGREVAIKQIHQQFLHDPRQLERYWREAQLLATLQHPNILTIYDVVRSRGWLILELMRGNLQQSIQAGPMDLDVLRGVLICGLNALAFLHANGVVHGDVKPSNMLIDPQGRVKLGDFGLARRASNEQGSLLKGTTKYMAPELVSNQFGPVGPASDLYSLGFAAYELMCGPQFESLFPGLLTYGRDRQIAWLMWHAAPDRHLPEIARVLEGVPADLARVIERMVVKDQSRRYQSAQEALRDLRSGQFPAARVEPAPPTAAAETPKKKRWMRIGAIAAMAFSAVISVVMLLPGPTRPPPEPQEAQPVQGIVRSIYPSEARIAVEAAPDGHREELEFKPIDKFYINKKEAGFRDLRVGDQVEVEILRDAQKRRITVVHATRPESQQGRIKAVDPDAGKFTLSYETDQGPAELAIRVPETVKILFNGQDKIQGKPVTLADLRAGDRVDQVSHLAEEGGARRATALEVQREVVLKGVLRGVDLKKGELTVAEGEAADAPLITLPLGPKCDVTVNDRTVLDQRALTPADLKPGDKVTLVHDRRVVRVDAYRTLGQAGVVRSVQPNAIEVLLEGQNKTTTYAVDSNTKITLGGEAVALGEIRQGDTVDITHDSPDADKPRALTVAARRAADPTRWAILIGIQNYDDPSLGKAEDAAADAALLHEIAWKRFHVPQNQALLLTDANQPRLKQGIAGVLERIQPGHTLVVYFAGHAFQDADKTVYLAPKDFHPAQMARTGVSLQWLVDALEVCKAKEKILLLDACRSGPAAAKSLSPAEMFQSLKGPPGQAPLRTVTGIASCSPGQQSHGLPDKKHGLFAWALSEGLAGKADKNSDNRLETTELFSYLAEAMGSLAGSIQQKQTPQLFLPDNRPPRLSAEAKKAIQGLAALARQNEMDLPAARSLYDAAQAAAGKEIEPKLVFGLVLLKSRQPRADVAKHFESVKAEHPALVLPSAALAWLRFEMGRPASGVDELVELVGKIGKQKGPEAAPALSIQAIAPWIGRLREYAAAIDEKRTTSPQALARLDEAVAGLGETAAQLYEQGRKQTRARLAEIDAQIESADEAAKARLRIARRKVAEYAQFPFDAALESVLAALDR